jgi:PIN domain nuclease of toxin-antitoxin system
VSGLLLDTCALLWFAQGEAMSRAAQDAIDAALEAQSAIVSIATAWDIGLLCRPRGRRPPMRLSPDPETWFDRVLGGAGIREAPLTREIAFLATHLPGDFHADPADRFVVATAMIAGVPVVTRDRAILDYAAGGFVRVVAC